MLKPAYFKAETFCGSLYQEDRLILERLAGLTKGAFQVAKKNVFAA